MRRTTRAKQGDTVDLRPARIHKAVKEAQLAHIRAKIRLTWRVLARLQEQEGYWRAQSLRRS